MMEELTAITEMISNLGAEGKTAFIWYLVLDRGMSFLTTLVLVFPALFVLSRICSVLARVVANKVEA